ncbi:MAG: hypothetical protein NWF08_09960 [Candidatus Bathyarchaeota archaeon]|nr:hypothetical protein [Candidatus Bathyarchaeota archaeon]
MKKFRYILPIFLVALCILGLSFPSVNAQNGAECTVEIYGAPPQVQVCTKFQVDLEIDLIDSDDEFNWCDLVVVVDTNYMKIVDYTLYLDGDCDGDADLSPDGGRFELYVGCDDEWGGATFATLTIHCEGQGASVIRFDRDETFVGIYTYEYTLEYEEPTVIQYSPATRYAVGGYSIPASRLSVVAPHIALVALIVAITATVMIKKRNKL